MTLDQKKKKISSHEQSTCDEVSVCVCVYIYILEGTIEV